MIRKRALSGTGWHGFSLVEIIVVVAIMSILGTVLAPQLLRYVNQNRATACQVDREGILAVYERCIYDGTAALEQGSLQDIINVADTLNDEIQAEASEFDGCPLGGTYTGRINGGLAIIECSCSGHEEVAVDFAIWSGTELAEGIDEPFTQPPPSSVPEPDEADEPDSEEETTTEENGGGSIWPYEDDPRWDGRRYQGQIVEIPIPTPVFTSQDGADYVVVSHGDSQNTFPVHWEWSRGPEAIDASNPSWDYAIACSGIVVTDIDSIRHPDNPSMITGINYGDIVEYKGRRYIYGSHNMVEQKALPVEGANGNNFFLIATQEEFDAALRELEGR